MALLVDYESEHEAQALIEEAGGLDNVVSSILGDPVARPPQDNDIVLVNDGTQDIIGFVWRGRVLLRAPSGLVDWPLEKVEIVWCLKQYPQ